MLFFALLPDLVDKPIHYQWGLFASGRNLFHNCFILMISYGLYRLTKNKRGRHLALIAFLGIFTHFIGDLGASLLECLYKDLSATPDWYRYLLFPFSDPRQPPIAMDWYAFSWELIFNLAVILIWIRDGYPGLAFLRQSCKPG